ncbi:dihydroorotate dehydrogenase [Acrasis kona]|uniref:Dihydroorotate dehydrogenase n=1 Tax=Acrasis kona TaxID=1008807 RepID=A0AAW2YPI1_9EUKA
MSKYLGVWKWIVPIVGVPCVVIASNPDIIYPTVVLPVLHSMDAEKAHKLSVWFSHNLKSLIPSEQKCKDIDYKSLEVDALGQHFTNPIGVAAGYDKNAETMGAMQKIGFGCVEVGSVCPQPQEGNPKPRVFRVKSNPESSKFDSIINRYGFNSDGSSTVSQRLSEYRDQNQDKDFKVGVNLGKNKISPPSSNDDYVDGVRKLSKYADYLVINISSPNTPHLRALQDKDPLSNLLRDVSTSLQSERELQKRSIPLLVKIAPDLTDEQKKDIADLALIHKIDGIIISNTTISRDLLHESDPLSKEIGGLSGKPLSEMSTKVLRDIYKLTNGKVTLVGAGGISTGADILDKIEAGASLVQLYTSLTVEGPPIVSRLKRELTQEMRKRGYKSIQEAIGKKANVQ